MPTPQYTQVHPILSSRIFSAAQWADALSPFKTGDIYTCIPAWLLQQLLDDLARLESRELQEKD